MTVFLRWGALGLLMVSAIVYAYRVNQRAPEIAAALESQARTHDAAQRATTRAAPAVVAADELPPACNGIAAAIAAGRDAAEAGEPVDRALRQSLIAFEADPRRKAAMVAAATRAYEDARAGLDRDASIAAGACAPLLQVPAESATNAQPD